MMTVFHVRMNSPTFSGSWQRDTDPVLSAEKPDAVTGDISDKRKQNYLGFFTLVIVQNRNLHVRQMVMEWPFLKKISVFIYLYFN